MARHGVTFSKALGQNFIINPSVCPRIAEMGGARKGVGVLEIGPGAGVLTAELAARADKVVALELDTRLIPLLSESLAEFGNVQIIEGDALKADLRTLLAEQFGEMPVVVCANLPYYVTSPILMRLLEERLPVESITVMVQKEAAARICAGLGSRQSGAITAAVAYYSRPQLLFEVSRGSFLPAPEVDSAVIRLEIRKELPSEVEDTETYFAVVRGAFGQRRKTLLNSLSTALGISKEQLRTAMAQTGIRESARAEELCFEQLAALSNALRDQKGTNGR